MLKVNYISKDQNSMDGTTIFWFEIDGEDYGTEKTFDNETFGMAIVECNCHLTVIDVDGFPVSDEYVEWIVLRECKITEEMMEE